LENGLGNKKGTEDRVKGTIKGRIGWRRKLKKSQSGRLREKRS